jgi:hypothetical protein
MLPRAQVGHHIEGRTRFRVPEKRRDTAWFGKIAERLLSCEGVESVDANAATGSLLVYHATAPQEIGVFAEAHELFTLAPGQAGLVLSQRLGGTVQQDLGKVDRWLNASTRGQVDLASVAFLFLAGAGVLQALRGRALPAGITLLNYALEVLPRVGQGIAVREVAATADRQRNRQPTGGA